MGIFSPKKSNEKVCAIFDLSSGSVGGAHVLISKSHDPVKFLSNHRVFLQFQEELNLKRYIEQTISALDKAISETLKADIHKPTHVQFVLASPWFVSQTRTIIYKKEESFVFSEKLLNEIVDNEISSVLADELKSFGSFGKNGKIIEKQISQIKLNGYVCNNPFNKRAKEAELYLTLTISPEEILNRFKDTVTKHYHPKTFGFTTSPFTTFIATRDDILKSQDLTIIDVGEEVTDVAFVKGGLFLYQHSFPVGVYALPRLLINQKNSSYPEAESLLSAYVNGHLNTEAKKKVESIFEQYKDKWRSAFDDAIKDGHFGFSLPENILITSDSRYQFLFQDILSKDPVLSYLISATKPNLMPVDDKAFSGFVASVDNIKDIPLLTAGVFLNLSN